MFAEIAISENNSPPGLKKQREGMESLKLTVLEEGLYNETQTSKMTIQPHSWQL